jgi:hypothetical protein
MTEPERDYDAEIERLEQYGTVEQIELVRSEQEGRQPRETRQLPGTGAPVPPSQVRDAASGRPVSGDDALPGFAGSTIGPEFPGVTGSGVDASEVDETQPVREGDADVAPYDEWDKDDLVEEARVRKLKISGNKPDLVTRLRADDEEVRGPVPQ